MRNDKRMSILIVDDDINTCETLCDIFELNNFHTLISHNGEDSLKLMQKHDVDVAVLDIKLPDIDGLQLLKQLKKIAPEIICIFITGHASVNYVKDSYEQGANGFFVKPVIIEEILHVINEALEKRVLAKRYKKAESTLKLTLDEYTDLYNNAPDMYVSVDVDSAKVIKCNTTLTTTLGYTRDEIIGHSVFDLYHPSCQAEVKDEVFPAFLKTGIIKNRELTLQKKDGSKLPITHNALAAYDKNGTIIQNRSVWHDITDRKKLEEQFIVSEKMTTIAGLAAGVAHEINTPLSGILQSIQIIQQGLDPNQPQNQQLAADCNLDLDNLGDYLQKKELDFFFNGIKSSATTAARIVADLLQFSRPQESEWVAVNLAELVDRAVALAKTDYTLKKDYNILNVAFIREYEPDMPGVVCMAMEMEQVVINLIKNSCQALAQDGSPSSKPHIILRVKPCGIMALVEVEDNGPGMSSQICRQVFDPFFTTKDVGIGTGLGLAVSYSIICEKHCGTLEVVSRPDRETKFIIQIPINGAGSKQT